MSKIRNLENHTLHITITLCGHVHTSNCKYINALLPYHFQFSWENRRKVDQTGSHITLQVLFVLHPLTDNFLGQTLTISALVPRLTHRKELSEVRHPQDAELDTPFLLLSMHVFVCLLILTNVCWCPKYSCFFWSTTSSSQIWHCYSLEFTFLVKESHYTLKLRLVDLLQDVDISPGLIMFWLPISGLFMWRMLSDVDKLSLV
jgi:hypothetical protein